MRFPWLGSDRVLKKRVDAIKRPKERSCCRSLEGGPHIGPCLAGRVELQPAPTAAPLVRRVDLPSCEDLPTIIPLPRDPYGFPVAFTFYEMTASDIAARKGIANNPPPSVGVTLRETAEHMLGVRELLRMPIIVTSAYRSPEVNAAIGGAKNSAHMAGDAVDFKCPGYGTPREIAERIADSEIMSEVDQLIYEFGAWVHISFAKRRRGQVLTIDKRGKRAGLHA